MDVLFDRVAGIDVGKATVTVCVRTPGTGRKRASVTRTFGDDAEWHKVATVPSC